MSERYEIRGKLGRGGMSTIYRGFDTVMGREVAIKRLLPLEKTKLNEDAGNALEREAAALAKFQHPNIVSVFAIEEDSEGPYVVMELVEGQDLHFVLTEGALSWEDFQDVAIQCLEPLIEASELNLLHRDIKPGNIMVTMTHSGRFLVKILDFGLAKFSHQPSLQTLDQKGSFLGSIDYIAPEQLELRPLDQRTDLYSLGCVLYFSLAQKSPFTGENPAQTSMNHLKHVCTPIHELRSDIPEQVADWLMKMISRRPSDRPKDAAEALALFHAALAGVSPPSGSSGFAMASGTGSEAQEEPDSGEYEAHEVHSPSSAPVAPPPESEPVPPAATAVEETPSGPVLIIPSTGSVPRLETGAHTARQPVLPAPRTGAVPGRALTGAVPGRPRTGSVAGRPAVTGSIPGRSRTAPTSGMKPGSVSPAKKTWLILAGGAVLVGGILYFLSSGARENGISEEEEVHFVSPDPETLEPLDFPKAPFSWGEEVTPEPLAVSEGLVSRHLSGELVFGRDYGGTPEVAEQVAAWGDPSRRSLEALLVRDPVDQKGQYLPMKAILSGREVPNLKASTPALVFNNQSALKHRGRVFEIREAMTMVTVARMDPGAGRFLKVIPDRFDGRNFLISSEITGKIAGICKPLSNGKEFRIQLNAPLYHSGVFLHAIDAKGGRHRLSIGESATREVKSVSGTFSERIRPSDAPLTKLAIGKRAFQENFVEAHATGVFEVLLYDRFLSEEEGERLIRDLQERYFMVKGGSS